MSIDSAFTHFPVLETPNLILRRPRAEDAEAIFRILGDEQVVQYHGVLAHQTVEDSAELIEMMHYWYANRQGIRWMITRKDDDTVIGSCGFHRFDEEFRRAETGYELRRDLWRQGITFEAVRAILDYGFADMELNRIEAIVDEDNERSKQFLRKLGFTYEGCMRKRFWFRGQFWDEHFFGLLREDWS